jgi:hypothetical protein
MSRKPANKPSALSREEALERRLADLERIVRRIPVANAQQTAAATTVMVQQSAHGFAVKDVLRHNGTSWAKAQADTAANAVVGGIVVAVVSPDVFVLATAGYIAGLSGLTAGSVHYLSAATAGALTTTAPGTPVAVLLADSTTSGALMAMGNGVPNPLILGSASADGAIQIYGDTANGVVVDIQGNAVTTTAKALSIREIDVCDAGVAKKMLVLASAPY